MYNKIKNEELFELFIYAIRDGLKYIREYKKTEQIFLRYYDYPKISYFDNGLPHFSKTFWDEGPINYSKIFDKDFKPETINSWRNIYNYFQNNEILKSFYYLGDKYKKLNFAGIYPEFEIFHNKYYTYGIIQRMLCRYVEKYQIFRFSLKKFKNVYLKWENSVYLDRVPINIIIPIIFLKFDFRSVSFNNSLTITKMTEDFQLARNVKTSYTESAHETVIGAATHALVLKYWSVENKTKKERDKILNDINSYNKPIELVNLFFASIRIVTGYDVGFYQLIAKPIGWEDDYINNLPQIYLNAKKSYPPHFENYGWLREPPILSRSKCYQIYNIFKSLTKEKSNKLQLAANRLNSAFLRSNESDTILDIAIALEILIGDGRSEITHKLATRIGALSKKMKFGNYSPKMIFDFCKKIYDYRSALIHGSKKITEKKEIKINKGKKIPTIDVGIEILRYTILVLCKYPEYINTKKIDEFLLS